jgi:predicted GIY-YIG superfamily endonuclease
MTTSERPDLRQVLADWKSEAVAPCVYFLADPRTPNAPRYIGSTNKPAARLWSHAKRHASRAGDAEAWFAAVRADGFEPIMRVVATYATVEDARRAEWRLACRWRRRGLPIVGKHHPFDDADRVRALASVGAKWPRQMLRDERAAA